MGSRGRPTLRDECARAAEAAARPLLGPDGARELTAALWDDLDTREHEQEDSDG